MAGAIILSETAGWSVAGWAFRYAADLVLRHSEGLPPELRKRFEDSVSPEHMPGVMLTDVNGQQLDAVLDCLLKGYESEKKTRGSDWNSPEFWEPFMHGLQELIHLVNSDPRILWPRPALQDVWKESAES